MIAEGEDVSDVPEDLKIKIHYDKEKKEMYLVLLFDYKSLKELNKHSFFKGDKSVMGDMGGMGGQSFGELKYTISKGNFVRKGTDLSNSDMFKSGGADNMDMVGCISVFRRKC